jgi:hypothetical protein
MAGSAHTSKVLIVAAGLAVAALTLAALIAPGIAAAQSGSILVWNTFRGPQDDCYQHVAPAPGGVYASGFTVDGDPDVLVAKNSAADRNLGWRDWDNPVTGGDEAVIDMAVDRFGAVVMAGYTQGSGADDYDLLVLKLGADSQPAWDVVLDGGVRGDDTARSVACDRDGNVYVAGWQTNASGMDFWTLKLDAATGGTVWQAVYDGGTLAADGAAALCLDAARNVYVTGSTRSVAAGHGDSDIMTVKYDANGVLQWDVRTDGPRHGREFVKGIVLGQSGALFLAGDCYPAPGDGRSDADLLLVRLGTDGRQVWLRTLDDRAHWHNLGFALRVGRGNSAYLAGTMSPVGGARQKGIVARWNASGGLKWARIWGSSGGRSAGFNDVVIDKAGTAWCAGFMTSPHPGNDKEGLVCKYSAAGRNVWASGWEGPGRADDIFYSITLQGSNALFAAGSSAYRGRGLDGAIVKYQR